MCQSRDQHSRVRSFMTHNNYKHCRRREASRRGFFDEPDPNPFSSCWLVPPERGQIECPEPSCFPAFHDLRVAVLCEQTSGTLGSSAEVCQDVCGPDTSKGSPTNKVQYVGSLASGSLQDGPPGCIIRRAGSVGLMAAGPHHRRPALPRRPPPQAQV